MKVVLCITGASGVVYGVRILEELAKRGHEVDLIVTQEAEKLLSYEVGIEVEELKKWASHLYREDYLEAPIASGSQKFDALVIAPCSMKTAAGIAHGYAENLVLRTADVALKEGRKLILVVRETPLNAIHLENLLKLSKIGVHVVPAAPGFYGRPRSVEDLVNFIVGKVLDLLGVENDLAPRWSGFHSSG
ncbi:MAG TPA: UbiX family flavin prenyltransferase [Candidatus Methanomethylia archaeon]|nr:UbiX family flavin prenyltransferase [Candidatus Methanomethylicia archaeon]